MKRIVLLCAALWWPTAYAGLEETRASAEAGDVERQLELGELYEFGFGMPNNDVPALTWYIVAADNGHPKAAKRRDLIKKRLSREQIAEAERESAKIPRRVIRPAVAPPTPAPRDPAPAPRPTATPPVPQQPAPTTSPAPADAPAPREALDPLPAPTPSSPPPAQAEPAPAPAPTQEPALISSPPSRTAPKEELLGPP